MGRTRIALRAGGLAVCGFLALLALKPTSGDHPPGTRAGLPALAGGTAGQDALVRTPRVAALPRDAHFARAASALRHRDCAEAQAALAPHLDQPALAPRLDQPAPAPRPETERHRGAAPAPAPPDDRARLAADARLLSGLYAHACENVELTAARLAEPHPSGLLEDWRLLLLAEASHAARPDARAGTADAALESLLSDHPESPLRRRAIVTAVEQAAATGRTERTLELVRRSRQMERLPHETIARIEARAWELGDAAERAAAARRLLVHAPDRAAELGVLDVFQPVSPTRSGTVDWRAILDLPELRRRAETLLDAGRAAEALATLEEIPAASRDVEWRLLAARALTRERRAREALDLLDAALLAEPPPEGPVAVRIAWERALAAESLASPLRSGAGLSTAERHRMRQAAHDHLAHVVSEAVHSGRDGDDSRELALAALRRLFADHVEEERFDRATHALRLLRRLDPGDTTGAGYLWNEGWEEYRHRNYTGAVGYWSELASLYPESGHARSGRYWTARAFEELGHRERAREILREVAAVGSTDFYRKHALSRLDGPRGSTGPDGPGGAPPSPLPSGRQPWPDEPALARARLLTDLGLDALALAELEGVRIRDGHRRTLDPAAVDALTGLSLARQGRRRAAIPHLRRAFPALGGPHQDAAPIEAQRLYYPVDFSAAVDAAAESSGLPHHLVYGMIREESAFDVTALSHAGARGLMQLMPATGREMARRLGLRFTTARLEEPAFNIRLGAAYFARVLEMFDGEVELALAGYNGGPYRLKRLWRSAGSGAEIDYFTEALPIEESKGYVKRVILFANSYRELYGM